MWKSEVRDGMRIDWDVEIPMDDGISMRADVFRPDDDGTYPVILSYGPYAKGLAFQEIYEDQWNRMIEAYPDVAANSTNKYQNWEVVDPEKWVPEGYACVRVDSRGTGMSPGYIDHFSPRETQGLLRMHRMVGGPGVVQRQGRPERHQLPGHQPVARGVAAAAIARPPCASGKGPPSGTGT